MKVGVLALQGDFELHARRLIEIGVDVEMVKKPSQLDHCQGLIMPGGESTTLVKLLRNIGLYEALPVYNQNRPIFGTCAGTILLAKTVTNHPVDALGLIDIDVERNAYGTQVDSFADDIQLSKPMKGNTIEGVFIRAPRITRVGEGVKAIAHHQGEIVMVQGGNVMAATFHPEVSQTQTVHRFFVENMIS